MSSASCDYSWQTSMSSVLQRSCFMFNNPLLSDITITCGTMKCKQFNAHKYVLATSSPVFYAMFYGESYGEKTQDRIHFDDADDDSFEELLRFIYTDECQLSYFDLAIKVLYQAKKYLIPALASKCVDILVKSITPENVILILEEAIKFEEKDLEQKCWNIVDTDASRVVSSDAMSQISQQTMCAILKRDTMKIKEIELYRFLLDWLQHQCTQNNIEPTQENKRRLLGNAFWDIRFLSMTEAEFAHFVSVSELLTPQESLAIFQKFNGLCNTDFPWKHTERGTDLSRLSRHSLLDIKPPDGSWSYAGCPDRLDFRATTQIMIHGVHLFGSQGAKYQVTLQLEEECVTGLFSSEFIRRGKCSWFGFDVLLKKPVKAVKGKIIEMSALIQGAPSYYYESCELPNASDDHLNKVSIEFHSSAKSANGTCVSRGQFCEIIYLAVTE